MTLVNFLLFFLLSIRAAEAGTLEPPAGYSVLKDINLDSLVGGIIQLILLLTFVASVIFLMIGGLRWVLSGGDKQAAESAKGTLTAAIMGLIITLSVWAILWLIEQLFGIQIVGRVLDIPTLN